MQNEGNTQTTQLRQHRQVVIRCGNMNTSVLVCHLPCSHVLLSNYMSGRSYDEAQRLFVKCKTLRETCLITLVGIMQHLFSETDIDVGHQHINTH